MNFPALKWDEGQDKSIVLSDNGVLLDIEQDDNLSFVSNVILSPEEFRIRKKQLR